MSTTEVRHGPHPASGRVEKAADRAVPRPGPLRPAAFVGTAWQFWDRGRSWALVDDRPGIGKAVQGGPRRLWDEVDAALPWHDERRLHGFDFGITVVPGPQWAGVERPDRCRDV
ncbi:hypothetical protein ACIRL2_47140 [Embleya sp. NPDC127516]|uniref:hypothetical protein n=1 Tax=Embleya sp. NPDC127516 TaxID=3363990 RepID=UPI00382624A0